LVATLLEKAKGRVSDVHVEEVDVTANPDVAVKYRVMATPAIAIDGKLEFTGVPREEALRAKLEAAAERSP
jgi:predicted thioredoxin/glutaredoxin